MCLAWKKADSAVSVNPPWRRTSKGSNMFVYNCILPIIEPPRDKTNNVAVRPVWSESSLCTQWVAKDPSFLHADSEDSDQTGRMLNLCWPVYEPRHDKTNKMSVRPAKTQNSLGIRPVWSESSLSVWRKLDSLATH